MSHTALQLPEGTFKSLYLKASSISVYVISKQHLFTLFSCLFLFLGCVLSQQRFQHWFNVVFRLIWCCYFEQRQINVETTLCTSTLKLCTSQPWINAAYFNVDNKTLTYVEIMLLIWPCAKSRKINLELWTIKYFELQIF